MLRIGSIALLLFFVWPSFAQNIKAELNLSQGEVGVGDFFEISVSVNADKNSQIEEPQMPNFADFSLQGTSTQVSDQVSIINGEYKFLRKYIYNYTYRAESKGVFDIPPIAVSVGGKVYRTNGAKIRVLDQGQAQRQQRQRPGSGIPPGMQDPLTEMEERFNSFLQRQMGPQPSVKPINPDEAFSLRIEVDKEEAYVGEQITASYYIYIPDNVVLRSIDTMKFPSLNQFWKEDIEISTKLRFGPTEVNGQSFKRALLASYALFPIKHGRLKIDAYKAKCSVAPRVGFGFGKSYNYTKSSDEIKVSVLPLPDNGRPDIFTGAVGDFNISARIEDRSFEQGQPFTMKVKLEGRGNAKVIDLPFIDFQSKIDFFDSKEETRFFPNGQSFKEFTLYLTPLEAGLVEIPAIEFAYFDPEKNQYITKSTKALQVNVMPSRAENIQGSRLEISSDQDSPTKLPDLFTQPYQQASWYRQTWLVYLMIFIFSAGMIHLMLEAKRGLFTSSQKKIFLRKIESRKARLKQAVSDNHKQFAIEALNFIYFH